MFVFDILIYVCFAWVMHTLAHKSYVTTRGTPKQNKLDVYLWMYIGFYVFICAIRYGVGVDSISYAESFKYGYKHIGLQNEGELLWNGFIAFIAENGLHFTVGMAICAFLQIYPLTKALQDQKAILCFLPIALFGSFYFLSLNNGVRQMIVACWFLYATKWIAEKKLCKYLLFLTVAHYVHTSSIILAPLYFVNYIGNISSKRWICVGVLFACLFIGLTPQFQFLISRLEDILLMIGYDSYTDRMEEAMLGENENQQSFGLQKMSYFISFLAITYWGKDINARFGNMNKYFQMWWFLGYCYGCLYFLVGSMSYLFQRPIMYIELFALIMLSYLLHYLYCNRGTVLGNSPKTVYWMLIISMWASISWQIIKATNRQTYMEEHVTYKTIFTHDI